MIKILSSFKSNEIRKIDSPFREDPTNIFFHGCPNFEEKTTGKCREKWAITGDLLLSKSGVSEFRKSISSPTPLYQNPCDASIFLHARPNFMKK